MRGGYQLEDATASKHAQASCCGTGVNERVTRVCSAARRFAAACWLCSSHTLRPSRYERFFEEWYGYLGLVGERQRLITQRWSS